MKTVISKKQSIRLSFVGAVILLSIFTLASCKKDNTTKPTYNLSDIVGTYLVQSIDGSSPAAVGDYIIFTTISKDSMSDTHAHYRVDSLGNIYCPSQKVINGINGTVVNGSGSYYVGSYSTKTISITLTFKPDGGAPATGTIVMTKP